MGIAIVFAGQIMPVMTQRLMRRQLFEPALEIAMQALFVIINKDRSRNMHRIDQTEPLNNFALSQAIFNLRGNIEKPASLGYLKPEFLTIRFHPSSLSSKLTRGCLKSGNVIKPLRFATGAINNTMKKVVSLTLALTLTAPGLFTGCREISSSHESQLLFPPQQLSADNVAQLQDNFSQLDYSWDTLEAGVPAFTLERLPSDLRQLNSSSLRKQIFFQALLPMVLQVNSETRLEQRDLEHLLNLLNAGRDLDLEQQDRLQQLATRYRVKGDILNSKNSQERLRLRVHALPPALVLAQAANESGYGTSRFARQANNLFGEWTFTPGTGLVPKGRPEGATYEVRRFPTILHSLRSYMLNLNSHWAYTELRQNRHELILANQPVTGNALANGLQRYSERGTAYIAEIKAIIRANHLERLADARLRQPDRLRRYGRPERPLLAAS